jgi:hypothetical protein
MDIENLQRKKMKKKYIIHIFSAETGCVQPKRPEQNVKFLNFKYR